MFVLDDVEGRNRRAFKALEEHAKKLFFFIRNSLKKVKLYVNDYFVAMIGFVDWIDH